MGKKKVLFAGVLAAVFATSAGALVACSDEVEAPAGNDGVHAVTFDANGGTFKDGKTVKINTDKDGKIVTEPTAPTYADHTFKGYTVTKDGDSILTLGANGYKFTADQTIYAKWEANTPAAEDIVITFNVGENGTMTGATTAKAVNGKLASLPTVTAKTGWTWEGWYTAATAGEKVTTATVFTKSATIYAQYKAEVVVTEEATITLDVGAGTLPTGVANTLKTVNGKLASLPTPTAPEGKKFDGWYTKATDGTKVTTSTVFEADGTIYAVYKDQSEEDEEFTITFDVGAHGTLKDEETSAETLDGMLVELPEVEPAEGWYFKGWFDKATGGEKVTDETVFEADATIYAVYAAAPCVKVGEKNIYLNENTEGLMPGQLAEYMILKVELEVNDTLTFMMMDEESGEYVAYPVYIQGDCKGIDVSVTSSKVNSATVLRAGEYDIYIKLWTSATDKNNWAFYATDGGSIIREEQNLTEGALYAVGGMNDWQLKEAFEIKENKLVLDLLADQELLVGAWKQGEEKPEMDWDTAKYDYNKLDTASQAIVGDANGNVKILEEGKYIITIVSTTEWKIEKVAEEPPVVVEYTITFNAGEGTCATASAETVDGKL
ncbi:MAG: InlB B-repeat-containing protein, partial [Clostridiales bacterium]|nr:InlB B-repeat-containing protein [Clostridiales bacterium]